jgi:hypothetical protein
MRQDNDDNNNKLKRIMRSHVPTHTHFRKECARQQRVVLLVFLLLKYPKI